MPRSPGRPIHRAPAIAARLLLACLVALSASGLASASAAGADHWPIPASPGPGAVHPPRPPVPPRAVGSLTFFGRGWGHGVGLSQYGARGRALAGQLAPTILAHYYAGTTLGRKSPSTIVRVLVLTGYVATMAKPATITGRGGTWSIDGISGTWPADARVTFVPAVADGSSWTLQVLSSTGSSLRTATVKTAVIVRPVATATALELTSKATTSNVYRGFLRVRLTTTAMVIDHVAVDDYLRGVVPAEMPSSWPAEALKAQAIAARSYALSRIHPTTGTYDLYDDTRSQVYRGRRAETTATNAAIAATSGTVVLSGTSVANTLYHSSDGGWTENNENVFVGATGAIVAGKVSYLRGSSDRAPDGTSYDASSPSATWTTATYTMASLSAIFAKDSRTDVGAITALDLSQRGVSGRLIRVVLTGSLGTKTVSGAVFVSAFNAGKPAADPQMRGTLVATGPIP